MDNETRQAFTLMGAILGAILVLVIGIAYKLQIFFWQ